jgi:hypothetical protein
MRLATFAVVLVVLLVSLTGCQSVAIEPTVAVGDDTTRTLRPRANSQFLRGLYTDLVGRAPEIVTFVIDDASGAEQSRFPLDEEATLSSALDGVGDPAPMRALIVAGLLSSAEVTLPARDDVDAATFVTEQFHKFLGREPGAYERAAFVDAWNADPAVGPRAVVRAILASREYQSF